MEQSSIARPLVFTRETRTAMGIGRSPYDTYYPAHRHLSGVTLSNHGLIYLIHGRYAESQMPQSYQDSDRRLILMKPK